MSADLTFAEIKAGLTGKPLNPFKPGRRVELVMDTGRLVRGEVTVAGKGVAQLKVGWIPTWKDAQGESQPGYPHIALIVYDQVVRWREPNREASVGNWNPGHPRREAEESRPGGKWRDWPGAAR